MGFTIDELVVPDALDAPSAGMAMVPDPWDAGRVREHDGRIASSGRTMLTATVEHVLGFREIGREGSWQKRLA